MTAGASVEMSGDTVSSNLVHGENRPIGSVFAPTPNNDPYPLGNHAENNQNLRLGAAVRLVGAAASTITRSNITDNAFGVLNTTLDGVTANTAAPVSAMNNWWGLRTGTLTRADSRPGGVARRRGALVDDLQPSGTREPGQRLGRRERELPCRRLRFERCHVLPVSLERPVGHRGRRVPDSRGAGRDRRSAELHVERRPARPEHPDVRLILRDDARQRHDRQRSVGQRRRPRRRPPS